MTIETVEGFTSEGVLIMANITKCKDYFSDKEFDYDYPEGLSDLLMKGIIHIITTEEAVEVIEFAFDPAQIDLSVYEYKDSYNYLNVEEGDEIRLVSHAAFTQMCSNHQGDLEAQVEGFLPIRNILNPNKQLTKEAVLEKECPVLELPVGQWKVNVYTTIETDTGGWPEFTIYFEKMDNIDLDKITLQPIEFYG